MSTDLGVEVMPPLVTVQPLEEASQLAGCLDAVALQVIDGHGVELDDPVRVAELEAIAVLSSSLRLGSWGMCPGVVQDWRRHGDLNPSADKVYVQALEALARDLDGLSQPGDLASVSAVIEWMGAMLISEVLPTTKAGAAPKGPLELVHHPLVAALSAGNFLEVEELLLATADLHDRDIVISDVIVPAIREIGDRWQRGELSEAHASRAGRLLERASVRVLAPAHPPTRKGRVAVIVPEGDPHRLGAQIAADSLAATGWEAIVLPPARANFELVMETLSPDVIAVSVTLAKNAGRFAQAAREWRADSVADVLLIGGGRVLGRAPDLGAFVGCDLTAGSASQGAVALQQWWDATH